METEIEEESVNNYNYNDEQQQSRYLTQKKKQYLLASNTESIGLLIQSQIDQLTDILIQQKSELDKLTRQSHIKVEQSELLDKKIKALQGMDSKTKKKSKENKETIETMKDVIKIKNGRKAEENYNKKTLQKQVDKLNQDILLIQKEILAVENKGKILDKKLEKARLSENNIRQKRNDVNFQVTDQNLKNKYDKSEQALLISYYETVIKQKYMFIQSADERKEKQKKIQQEAKNDSQDKQEVEKRNELHLLVLYNQYLREKMAELLKNNEKVEETLDNIRDITGTDNLDLLVEIVLLRGKRYNYCVKRVAEEEKKRFELKEDIINLNNEYVNLKNQVLVQQEQDEAKSISTIQTSHIEDDEKELIDKEQNLIKTLYDLGEKHNKCNLAYSKVLENMKFLKEVDDQDPRNEKKEEEKEEEEGEYVEKEEIDLKDKPKLHTEEENNQTTHIETKKEEENKEEENKENENKEEENKEEENKEEENKEEENKENENKEEENKENENKEEDNKENEIKEEKPKIILTEEEESIIQQYKSFLKQSSKKFDLLYLMHSKQEFINIMQEIGKENEVEKSYKPLRNVVRRVTKRKTSRLFQTLSRISRASRVDLVLPIIEENKKKEEEDEKKSIADPDRDILKRFLDEQKKERDDFVNVNNENAKTKKKK